MTPAAERIRALASRLFAAQTMERVVDPILADLHCEYADALARGRRWRARLHAVRGWFALARAVISLGLRAVSHAHMGGAQADAARTCIVTALAAALFTIPLIVPPLLSFPSWQADPAFGARLALILVPQALPLSIPAGLCVAVLWAMRGERVTWRRVGTVLAIGLIFTMVVWVVLEWMMPDANQAFRELIAARVAGDGRTLSIPRGLNELGLSRLGRRTDAAAVRQYHVLWALCCASVPLGLVACGLARHVRRAGPAAALAVGLAMFYFAVHWAWAVIASGSTLPIAVGAWMPNMTFFLMACVLLARAARSRNSGRVDAASPLA
ncbi:MAG TPA: LptF/LptG family permease [Vicinamibacterales bacterium]|nr:LptF/LptG family permease [Vicinamibacterales bacterium]